MVKVVIGTKVCSFEELVEEYNRVCKENEELKKQISELESEMGRKEEKIWVKEEVIDRQNKVIDVQKELIGNLQKDKPLYIKKPQKYPIPTNEFCCAVSEEPLPFSDEQYKEETKVELPTMPIDVASMLINATVKYPTPSICKVFGAGDTSFSDKYSESDLREIAEHLLVYCNNYDEDDEDKKSQGK